jgi:IS30 family transposase
MDPGSRHLSSEECGVIFSEHSRGSSQRAIGRLLGRPASTICRELARGRQGDGSCCATAARRVYTARRTRCRRRRRLVEGSATYRFVHDHLVHRRWSPEQIAHRLRLMEPDNPSARVSHETIYAAICAQPRGGLKAAMVEALRQAKPARGSLMRASTGCAVGSGSERTRRTRSRIRCLSRTQAPPARNLTARPLLFLYMRPWGEGHAVRSFKSVVADGSMLIVSSAEGESRLKLSGRVREEMW